MAQTKHDPDVELVALGIGNILCPFFGGIAATGAIARTATKIRFGAKSPLAAMTHSVFTLLVVLIFAPTVSYLPMSALAALLILVAYNMAEIKHFAHIVKVAPRSDVIVLLSCFGLTVLFDMVVGVTVGIVLAALLFMRRMASVTSVHGLVEGKHPHLKQPLPQEIFVYEVAGPLFFGAAQHAVDSLSEISDRVQVVIFYMENVPVMDVTGLVAFESTLEELVAGKRQVYLVGLKSQPAELIRKTKVVQDSKVIFLCDHLSEAIEKSKGHLIAKVREAL